MTAAIARRARRVDQGDVGEEEGCEELGRCTYTLWKKVAMVAELLLLSIYHLFFHSSTLNPFVSLW
jgi:hypothetical protein